MKSYCAPAGIALLSAMLQIAAGATRGPDGAGYTATDATAYTFVDISAGGGSSSVLAGVDDGAAALTLPFTFRFYGQNYTSVCVSSNGAVYFTDAGTCATFNSGGLGDFANTDLSATATPGDLPALLPLWTDLTFGNPGAGAVYYQTIGTVPNRRFVIQWQMAFPQGSSLPVTFEAILSEGTNKIGFQYAQVGTGAADPAGNGGLSTVGIRKAGGAANQIQWSYNSAVLSNNYAIAFGSTDPNGGGTPLSGGGGGTGGGGAGGGGGSPAVLTVSWNTPAPIVYGTPLGANQLNATANASGTFVYSPPAGTILPAGQQMLSVTFRNVGGTASGTVMLTVNQAPQTITFAPIGARLTSDGAFTLSATASSGLPVTFSVVSGPATITGGKLQVTGVGNVVVQAAQPGNANYLAAASVMQSFAVTPGAPAISSVLNAASYSSGTLASGEYAVIFGSGLAAAATSATALPLPTSLGGVTVTITDASGATFQALLNYVSPAQINFVMPDGLAPGVASVAVTNSAGQTMTSSATIAALSPGLFSADSSGTGAPAALVLTFGADNSVQVTPAFSCRGTPAVCTAVAIPVADATQKVFLSLYGTGIRGRSDVSGVTATLGGTPVRVLFAGPQPTVPGLDQINIALDTSLSGTGSAMLQIIIDGIALNPVTINVQ